MEGFVSGGYGRVDVTGNVWADVGGIGAEGGFR